MAKKTKLKKIAESQNAPSAHGVVQLLLADHKLLRSLMKKVKSDRATDAQVAKAFRELEKSTQSHVKAEEKTFFSLIKENPKFEDLTLEGYEEHRVHENVLAGVHRVKDKERKIQQMKIFCEVLEHHLDEEEEELFPRFKKYAALSTRKKIGKNYLMVRKLTNKTGKARGATRFAD